MAPDLAEPGIVSIRHTATTSPYRDESTLRPRPLESVAGPLLVVPLKAEPTWPVTCMMRYVLIVIRAVVIARMTAHGYAPCLCWANDFTEAASLTANHLLLKLATR